MVYFRFHDGSQASIGSKRVQNNVLPRSGDWICHTCRNLNFSFRHFCHKQYCNALRPPSAITPAPLDAQVTNHPPHINYVGVVIPPPPPPLPQFNYGRVAIPQPTSPPPSLYGIPIRYGPSIPHFGHPVPSIPPGSFGGIAYSPRPSGYGFQGPPPRAAGLVTNNSTSHKSHKHRHSGPGILTKGNWICPKCMNVNFASRSKCNIKKCGAAKPKGLSIPDGSWTCKNCGNINYPFRTKCNIKDCRVERSASAFSQITSK